MKLTKKYIISKGFNQSESYREYPTWSLGIGDICYYISFLKWRGDYSLYIEYTDPIRKADEGERYSFATLSTQDDLDAFLKIMLYREYYKKPLRDGYFCD